MHPILIVFTLVTMYNIETLRAVAIRSKFFLTFFFFISSFHFVEKNDPFLWINWCFVQRHNSIDSCSYENYFWDPWPWCYPCASGKTIKEKYEKCVFHVTLNRPIFVHVKLVLVTRATLKLTNRMPLQEKNTKSVSIRNIISLHRNMKKFDFHP